MPSIKDQSTVKEIAREFISNGRNKTEALKSVGYSHKYIDNFAGKIWGNIGLTTAIAEIDAKTAKKCEHNRKIAIKLLTTDLQYLTEKAADGNIQAIQARTGIIRELDAISNLHSSTLHTDTTQIDELEAAERTEATAIAAIRLLGSLKPVESEVIDV